MLVVLGTEGVIIIISNLESWGHCRTFLDIQFLISARQDIEKDTLVVAGFNRTVVFHPRHPAISPLCVRVGLGRGCGWGCGGRQPGSSQETEAGREWFLFPYHHILSSALTTAPFTPFTTHTDWGSD